jgi:hypothetical protein
LKEISGQANQSPSYIISDNASVMNRAIKDFDSPQIKDISHTLGMFMERIYSKDAEFTSYMKELSEVKFKHIMNPVAYLLPPKQRSVARFLNLSQVVDWSDKILANYAKLKKEEKQVFSFIPSYSSLINELRIVLSCINFIEYEIKHNGLSRQSVNRCRKNIKRNLSVKNKRMENVVMLIMNYFRNEIKKLPSSTSCWNASSDIVESIFGVYKSRKSPNLLHGITPFALFLPLHARIGSKNGIVSFDFKSSLESVFMSDIDAWKKDKLSENMVYKRIKMLKAA